MQLLKATLLASLFTTVSGIAHACQPMDYEINNQLTSLATGYFSITASTSSVMKNYMAPVGLSTGTIAVPKGPYMANAHVALPGAANCGPTTFPVNANNCPKGTDQLNLVIFSSFTTQCSLTVVPK